MLDKNLKKDTSFILLATLLIIFYIINSALLSSNTIEELLIPGFCFAFAFVILAWIITDRSHLRTPWPYLTIFILTFLYTSFGKIIYFLLDSFRENRYHINHDFLRYFSYFRAILNFFIILIVVIIFWYLVKPKDFQNKKYYFLKKENLQKIILCILIPLLITIPFWLTHLILFFNKNFFIDLFSFGGNIYHWFFFLYAGIPLFFAAVFFAILINKLKIKTRFYLYSFIGILALIQFIPYILFFDIYNSNIFSFITFESIKNGFCFFFIFLSLVLLSKQRYLE